MAIAQSPGERMTSAEQRRLMVDRQIRTFDVTDQVVIARLLDVPRELFVDDSQRALAYSDAAIQVTGEGGPRTMLTPLVLARMLQAAEPQPTDRVLDVAGGTGYTAALLAGLVAEVVAVESDAALSARAESAFRALGLTNVRSVASPVARLPNDVGAFDLIFVNGLVEDHLSTLASFLAPGGRIVAVVRKTSGALAAAIIEGRGSDLSVRPLFDAQAPVLEQFRQAPAFVF